MKCSAILSLLVFLFSHSICQAQQQRAVTDTGVEIIVNENGTWTYANVADEPTPVENNPTKFTKSQSATFLLKSTKLNIGVWLDPKKWKFKKGKLGGDYEYTLESVEGRDLYALVITEGIPIPKEAWPELALLIARKAAPDMRIVKRENRTVNGVDVHLM